MADKKTDSKNESLGREYVIPLRPEWRKVARYKRTNKAVKAVKEFLVRHMKIRDGDLNKVRVDKFLNEELWRRGIKNPPTKIKVKAVKDSEGIVRVELAEIPEDIKFKKARIDKRDEKAREIVESKKSTMTKLKETVSGATGKKSEKPSAEALKSAEEKTEESEKEEEAQEKKAATVSSEEKIEKEISKSQKHSVKIQNEKQAKGQRTGYNATSRGK